MTEAAWLWIAGSLLTLLTLAGGAIMADNRERIGRLEKKTDTMEDIADRVRLDGFQRLSAVEEATKAIVEASLSLRREIMERFDRQDQRLGRIEDKIDRNGRH